ncbi:MAG: hypothetical protein EPO26_14720 [Chloroflexota bacterium]|nr:MAG: hypothetical protein EPO26_14720 [Chloroflexota bacterium]
MKHAETDSFWADWSRLNSSERELFKDAVRALNDALAERGLRAVPEWPPKLRVRPMTGRPGIWELTWSFAGSDGRATFEIADFDGQPGIRWRRVGRYDVYAQP